MRFLFQSRRKLTAAAVEKVLSQWICQLEKKKNYLQKSLREERDIVYFANKGSDKQWNDSLENK